MAQTRLATTFSLPYGIFLILLLYTVDDASSFLCTQGNVSIISATTHQVLTSPEKCFPIPIVDRNQLHSKPGIQMSFYQPGPFRYALLMVEGNQTYNKYDVYWLETNLTVNNYRMVVQNMSLLRDNRKMIEYRPPKASPYNLTYSIFVYRQSAFPVESPPRPGSFTPLGWAASSHLTMVGNAQFIVKANQPSTSPHIPPAHHQPLPPPVGSYPVGRPQQPPHAHPTINAVHYNTTYRNYTNATYPRPPGGPYYPNQPLYPGSGGHKIKGHKGAAIDLKAASYLITLMPFLAYVINP